MQPPYNRPALRNELQLKANALALPHPSEPQGEVLTAPSGPLPSTDSPLKYIYISFQLSPNSTKIAVQNPPILCF